MKISPGNREEMLIRKTSVQTKTSARSEWLCVDSGIGGYQPQTACVSTINTRRAPCLGKKKQASRLRKAPVLTLSPAFSACAVPPDKNKRVLCRSNSFNAPLFFPPLSCDGIPVPWHNQRYTHETRASMHVFICACVCASTPGWCWQHCWEADIIRRSVLTCPHLTGRPFFYSPWGENRFLQASDNLRHTKA